MKQKLYSINLRLTEDQYAQVERDAESACRTIPSQIRFILFNDSSDEVSE